MPIPQPTSIFRLLHIDNLAMILTRGGLHAPNHVPQDGLVYRVIHHQHIQGRRAVYRVPCGPRGTIHDYVPFYFGPLSPMLLALRDGYVAGYTEGQEPLIYLVASAQDTVGQGVEFVFTDGHGVVVFTAFYADLSRLDAVDWQVVR
jgi:ssDNA thymidine ADP-ribosyltransferase, DarT